MTTTATRARPEHRYAPRGTARAIIEDNSPEILVSGPAGTGKSRACLEKLLLLAKLFPGSKMAILRKVGATLGNTALDTWRKHVAKEDLLSGEVWYYGGSQEEPPQYRFANGSRIIIGGLDKPIKIMSSEYDVIYVQEATELTIDDWEALTSRLRNGVLPYQQLIADCNPDAPFHWLYMRCHEIDEKTGRPACVMYNSTHEENPVLFDLFVNEQGEFYYRVTERGAAYMAKLDALTGVRYLRLRLGKWVAAEGIIYEEWSPEIHLVDPFPVPETWQRWWVVDFGYVNPFVCQMWAEDGDGNLYLYREIYHTQKTVDLHAQDIIATCTEPLEGYEHPPGVPRFAHHGRRWTEPRPRKLICDHDAEGRAQLLRELNMTTSKANKEVLAGIDAVKRRLAARRLFVLKGAVVRRDQALIDAKLPTCTADEFLSYVWDTGAGKKIKEAPLKEGDHGMDCVRYLVVHRDPLARGSLRVLG